MSMTCADPSSTSNKRRLSSDVLEITEKSEPELRSEGNKEPVARSKRQRLHLEIPTFPPNAPGPSSDHGHDTDDEEDVIISGLSEPNSLFDSPMDLHAPSTAPSSLKCSVNTLGELDHPLALRTAPPVPGLFFDPSLRLSQDLCEEVMKFCMNAYFQDENVNQVMLFERAPERQASGSQQDPAQTPEKSGKSVSGLPPVLLKLLSTIEKELLPIVPAETHALLFPSSDGTHSSPNAGRARQAIINLYHPGEGITPHVDLLKRFGDGIIGASFGSGCVMQFTKVQSSADDEEDVIISGLSEPNSLFDSPMDLHAPSTAPSSLKCSVNTLGELDHPLALRTAPPVPGLFFDPSLRLSQDLCEEVMKFCMNAYFQDENVNQVMLFERAPERQASGSQQDPAQTPEKSGKSVSGLPPVLLKLLSTIEKELLPIVPAETHALLFPSSDGTHSSPNAGRARQAIINLYHPGEGITPHVDLLKRFGDGIIGASFGSGCVMQFTKVQSSAEDDAGKSMPEPDTHGLYLPERSVVVLSKDARYGWTHGIGKYKEDLVVAEGPDIPQELDCSKSEGQWIPRGTRMSVTFRFLLPGAEVVGGEEM